jgi:hypothetical protein
MLIAYCRCIAAVAQSAMIGRGGDASHAGYRCGIATDKYSDAILTFVKKFTLALYCTQLANDQQA